MKNLQRLCLAIESLRTLSAVEAEWQALAGADHRRLKPFLRPRAELATAFPHADGGLPYAVVEHGPGDWVGVRAETGDKIPLTRRQLIVHELDQAKFANQVSTALGAGPARSLTATSLRLFSLGTLRVPDSSRSVESFLALPNGSRMVADCVAWLATHNVGPYLLATPTGRFVSGDLAVRIRSQGSGLLAIADAIEDRGTHGWRVSVDALEAAFSASLVREEPLSERARDMLVALLELRALDPESRRSTAMVASRALGPGSDANALKVVMAELVARDLVASKTGRSGGCWLTPAGLRRAEKLA